MAVGNLFESCIELTVAGIKNIKLMAKLSNGNPISFPIDVVLTGATYWYQTPTTIVGIINKINQTVTIGSEIMSYVEPYVDNSTFTEEETEDRRGKYYTHTLNIQFPKVELYTNNQIKDFLFTDNGELAIANAVAIITDNNDNVWIAGYDLPLVVEGLELTTGGDDNFYSMSLVGKSYERIRKFLPL